MSFNIMTINFNIHGHASTSIKPTSYTYTYITMMHVLCSELNLLLLDNHETIILQCVSIFIGISVMTSQKGPTNRDNAIVSMFSLFDDIDCIRTTCELLQPRGQAG